MSKKAVIKILLSIVLVAILLQFVDIAALWQTIKSIPAWVALTVVVGYALGQVMSAVKWWVIATSGSIKATLLEVQKSYFIGMFVNCFGFGLLGGDVARGVLLAKDKPVKTAALASVVADRVHGLAVLCVLGIVSVLLLGAKTIDSDLTIGLMVLGLTIACAWFLGPSLLLKIIPESYSGLREKG